MRGRGAAFLVPAVALLLVVNGPLRAAHADVKGAVIVVSPSTVAVGDRIRVDLTGWPEGVVTASVCGNAAKRGSADCDQIGGGSARIPRNGTETLTVDVLAPPVGCPCAVRAATTLGDVVRTAPIDVIGMPTGVDIAPAGGAAGASALHVTSQLRNADIPWPQSWFAAFAGPAHKELVLRMRNTGDVPLEGLRVAGRVGHRGTDEGEPIDAEVPLIPAHSSRQVVVPVLLSAPVYGDYTVKGAIYGLAVPVRFAEQTSSEPWALEIGLPLLLLLVAQLMRARDRRRRRDEDARLAASVPAFVDHVEPSEFQECSPAVGVEDERSWGTSPYSESVGSDTVLLPGNDPAPAGAGRQHP